MESSKSESTHPADKVCAECGNPIPLPRALRPKTKYCSYECYLAATEKRIEERLSAKYAVMPSRQDLEQLPLDDLIRVTMDSHFALWARGRDFVLRRLHEQLAECQAEEKQVKEKLADVQRQYEQRKADLPKAMRRLRWLEGPAW